MGNYKLRCCEDQIGILVYGNTTTPSCFNIKRIHCRVSGCEEIIQMAKYEIGFLAVIESKVVNYVKMDQLAKLPPSSKSRKVSYSPSLASCVIRDWIIA